MLMSGSLGSETAWSSRAASGHVMTQDANSNLLQNPGFDNGLASWSNAFSGPGSASVGSNSVIVSPGPSPMAALITSTAVHAGYQLSQCVNITGGTRYEAGTR